MDNKEFCWEEFKKSVIEGKFPVKKEIKDGISKPSISFDQLKKNLKSMFVEYQKESLLQWFYATSLLPGNELYKYRFIFLKQLLLSIPSSEFSTKVTDGKCIEEIIKVTDSFNWYFVEDFQPIKISKSNIFGLNGKIYNFLPENLEYPENLLERIVKRFFDFEKKIRKNYNYSIKKEFIKILRYQTKLIDCIEKNKNHSYKFGKFIIPKDKFVLECKQFLQKNASFSECLWSNNSKKVPEPSTKISVEEFFESHPIINKKVIIPYILIFSYVRKILKDLKKVLDENDKKLIKEQLELEVYNSLLEIVTEQGILSKFKIGSMKNNIDFGLGFDNKFFIFLLIEETFDHEIFLKKIKNKLNYVNKLKSEFSKKELIINLESNLIKIDKKSDPIFIIITDDFEDIRLTPNPMLDENVFIMPCSCLRHVMEDIADNENTIIFLSKVFENLKFLCSNSIVESLTFCDYYELVVHGNTLDDGITSFTTPDNKSPNITYINPHNWSENQRKRVLQERPVIDLRPHGYIRPFTFKTKKFSETVFGGYSHIIKHYFYCYRNNLEIYVLYDKNKFLEIINLKKREIFEECAKFLQKFMTSFFENLLDSNLIGKTPSKKIMIEIVPKEWALKNDIVSNPPQFPLLIGGFGLNRFLIILDPIEFANLYEADSKLVLNIIIEAIVSKIISDKQYKIILKKAEKINPEKSYKLTRTVSRSTRSHFFFFYPTNFDLTNTEMLIINKFKDKFDSGIYKGYGANKIINEVNEFLYSILLEKLEKYDLNEFIKFCYAEIERTRKATVMSSLDFRLSQGMELDYDNKEKLLEVEDKLNSYSPACRYLLELAISINISGREKISISDWQSICPIAMKMLNFAHISDYIYRLSGFFNISVKISNNEIPIIESIIKENPIEKKREGHIEGLRTIDTTPFLLNKTHLKGLSKNGIEYTPSNELIRETCHRTKKLLEKGDLRILSDEIEKSFGFRLYHYAMILNVFTHLDPDPTGLVIIRRNKLINYVWEKTKVDKKIIENVINFSMLNFEKSTNKHFEYWKINPRKNRLTIKPLVKLRDDLIFGHEALIFAIDKVLFMFIEGESPYSRDLLPVDVKKALDKKKRSTSKEFEIAVYKEVKKHSNICVNNICSKSRQNDKCLKYIKEPCPGQIDVLSIHLQEKTIVVWDAKNIEERFAAREISNKIEKFTKGKKGYVRLNQIKELFIKKHLDQVLDYFKIDEKTNWDVKSCIVLSSDHLLKFFLDNKYDIINYYDIEYYINNLK